VNRLYVFALATEACEPFELSGHSIESIETQGVYAVVERAGRLPPVSEQALRDQHEVIAHLHSTLPALLPARFGAFLDGRELDSIVAQRRDTIVGALRLVRGRSQMTIRALAAEPVHTTAAAVAGREIVSGTEYLESRKALATVRPPPLRAASEAVRGLAVDERFDTARSGAAAMLYHLVDRRQISAYRDLLARITPADGTVTVTGPWAPFAFTPDLWK
jgi:Gas vesicle synthesis protein GvpL/GvpF